MRTKLLITGVFSLSIWVGAVQVPDEAVFSADDVANQSIIWAQDDKNAKQCQATRIAPKWYLTAAHCVRPYCDKECIVTVQLLQGPLQVEAVLRHSNSSPHVFVPPAYHPGDGTSIRSDIALIGFDPKEQDYTFYDVYSKKQLGREEFEKYLRRGGYEDARDQWEVLQTAHPTLRSVTNSVSRKLLFPVAVPDLREDGIYVQEENGNGFYFFTELRHYIGPNFGVKKGMSGSGVVIPGGAIVGVVSSGLNNSGRVIIYNEKDEPVGFLPYSSQYFLFTPINQENKAFIEATVKSQRHRFGTGPRILPLGASYARQTSKRVQDVFGEFSSGEEILSTRSE